MPSFANVLEPKLTAMQTRIEAIKTKTKTSGAYDGVLQDLANVMVEAEYVHGFAGLCISSLRLEAE